MITTGPATKGMGGPITVSGATGQAVATVNGNPPAPVVNTPAGQTGTVTMKP